MRSAIAVLTVGGNELGLYDYLAFLAIFVVVAGTLASVVFMLGLPGRIAIARKHPEAEAVNVMGWAGFLAVVPWMQAFLWAFKPTDVIDVRRFPRQEQEAEREDLARLSGKASRDEKPLAPPSPPLPGGPGKDQTGVP
jgi:hypothetical protein